MPPSIFNVTPSGFEVLWDDNLIPFLKSIGTLGRVERVSHVDPGDLVDNEPTWEIHWRGKFADLFGDVTKIGEDGKPFFTKKAAVDFEVKQLLNSYF